MNTERFDVEKPEGIITYEVRKVNNTKKLFIFDVKLKEESDNWLSRFVKLWKGFFVCNNPDFAIPFFNLTA